jgi:LysR family transcriptional regulator, chromosome initiation inhibitor
MGIIENPVLSTFKKVAQTGSIHATARELGLTQTAVTKRIQAWERDLSSTLFIRSRRGMSLTDDGAALLKYCNASEELEGVFLSRISGKGRSDVQLTIVGPTSAISTRIVDNIQPLYSKHPHLRLHLRSDDYSNRIDLIRRGEADLSVVPPEEVPNEMDSKVLKPDRYFLVGSPRWKGRRLNDILENERIIDFYENDQTTRNYLKKFDLTSSVKRERIYVNENQALLHLFSKGHGFGTLTDSVARPHIESGELILLNKGQVLEDHLALAWYPRSHMPDYFSDIVRSIK